MYKYSTVDLCGITTKLCGKNKYQNAQTFYINFVYNASNNI